MKKRLQLQNRAASLAMILFLTVTGVLLFQAQLPDDGITDNDPRFERPTRESFTEFPNYQNPQQDIITVGDFDNFDIGVDFYEQYGSSNPNNPLWIFFGANASPQNARGTTNGGLNWYLNNPSYPGGTCCDPWATHTGSGVLIYASGVSGQYVYRSTNNGLNWSAPILSVTGVDRNHVSAEYTGTGPYANYVYAAITGSGGSGPFARSTDAGLTWTTTFTPSNALPGVYIAVGPNGTTNGGCVIYVTNTGSDFGNRVYNFYRSTNGGANFTLASSQSGWAGFVGHHTGSRHTINNARTAPHPKIAMDNSNGPFRGRLYMVHASNDPPGNSNKPDIWLRYSDDQAATWSSAIRVNDNPNPTLSDQWFPEIWCEGTTGKLYIHWYDDRSNPATFQTDLYATYSTTGGTSFVTSQRLNNQTFTFPNPPCSPNCYKGDYTTMTANNPKVGFSVWSDHRNASALNMGSYFPDFAMRVQPTGFGMNGVGDTEYVYVSIPAVKLYSDTAIFTANVVSPPGTGSISLALYNKTANTLQDRLTVFPDSLRLRIITAGGVPNGNYDIKVQGNGPNGTPVHQRTISINVGFVGITLNNNELPKEYDLMQNYPNPFNPKTNINFSIPEAGAVKLVVFDITGKEIAVLVNEKMNAGSYNADWDAANMPSGVYFYRITSGSFSLVKKMILVK
jgi:Secretion system C-terminal sorting domain